LQAKALITIADGWADMLFDAVEVNPA